MALLALKCTQPPSVEPVALADARLHLKETNSGSDIDAKINMMITAVRRLCENDCRRAFVTQSWSMVMNEFPRPEMNVSSATWYGPQWGSAPGPLQSMGPEGLTGYEIFVPLPPLISIDSINYVDQDGNVQAMDVGNIWQGSQSGGDIIVNNVIEPAVILPAYNTGWPATRQQAMAVTVNFTAGYGPDAQATPAEAKMWILAVIAGAYNLPEAEMAVYRETLIVPAFVDRLLDPLRIRRY